MIQALKQIKKNPFLVVLVLVFVLGLSFSSSINSNQVQAEGDEEQANQEGCVCTMEYNPVCGVDGETYSNSCMAECDEVEVAYEGECQEEDNNENGDEKEANQEGCVCTMEYNPVCGADGETYSNSCMAECDEVEIAYEGECQEEGEEGEEKIEKKRGIDQALSRMRERAQKLFQGDVEDILEGIGEKPGKSEGQGQGLQIALEKITEARERSRERLGALIKKLEVLSEKTRDSIDIFVGYGVDENTKALGLGERAAVIYSFEKAFQKLPESEVDMEDIIRISNGRWPANKSDKAEEKAKEKFEQIYKRLPNLENTNDEAAITVMAYGLRQRAENRNLNSERKGIEIFKNIFGYTPETTEDWNAMQAITYSGATR